MQARKNAQRPHAGSAAGYAGRNRAGGAAGYAGRDCTGCATFPEQTRTAPERPQPYRGQAPRLQRDGRFAQPVQPAQPFLQHYPEKAHRSSARSMATALTALLLVAAVGFAGWFSVQAIQGNHPVADAADKTAPGTSLSTPKSEWKQGTVPTLYQTDPEWANVRYAENSFSESGCGPTCMAMVYAALTGATDKDPAAMAALATDGGYAGPDGTAWLFMTEGARALGLDATEVPADEQSIRREIVAGRPVICSMGPGDFTTTGHFIVITDIDQNSNLVVRDPNSPERTAKSWSFDTVLGQCRALWSYSLI